MLQKKNVFPILCAVLCNVLWGLSVLATKIALNYSSEYTMVGYRFIAAFLLMGSLIVFRVLKVRYRGKPVWRLGLLILTEPIVYFTFESFGIRMSTAAESGIILALIPIVTIILSCLFFRERVRPGRVFFVALSILGVAFMVVMKGLSVQLNPLGLSLLFGAVLCGSLTHIISDQISPYFTPVEVTFAMVTGGAVFFPLMGVGEHLLNGTVHEIFIPLFHPEFVAAVVFLGGACSIGAFLCFNFAIGRLGASRVSSFSNLITLVSVLASVIVLGDPFEYYHAVGVLLILIGVWGANRLGGGRTAQAARLPEN
ncbi:MAG: DMT family transporter [Clostridiales bacterium]|nr:DMT family transporter [Clostridiales bacterium]